MAKYELSTKKKAAIRALVAGGNHTKAAAEARIHANTLSLWLKDPVFLKALHQAEAQTLEGISRGLLGLADQARTRLQAILENPSSQTVELRAIDVILTRLLQLRELCSLEARLSRLEAELEKTY